MKSDKLSITAKQHLANRRAAKVAGKFYPETRLKYWNRATVSRGDKGQIFCDNLDQIGDIAADDRGSRDRNAYGWYADSFQDALIYGAVIRMRTARGTYYAPATYCTQWDGCTAYMAEAERVPKGSNEDAHAEAIKEAIHSARHYAEMEAESAREDSAKDQASQQIDQCRDDIKANRAQAHRIIGELRTLTLPPALCGIARATMRSTMREARESVKRINALQADYWAAL